MSLCLTESAPPEDRCGTVVDRATLHELLMLHVGRGRGSGRVPIKAGSHLGHDHGLVRGASGVKHKSRQKNGRSRSKIATFLHVRDGIDETPNLVLPQLCKDEAKS